MADDEPDWLGDPEELSMDDVLGRFGSASHPEPLPGEVQAIPMEVTVGDPANDQMATFYNNDLDWHVQSTLKTLAQIPDGEDPSAMAVIATIMGSEEEVYPRRRLVSLLAVAFVRLARLTETGRGEIPYNGATKPGSE